MSVARVLALLVLAAACATCATAAAVPATPPIVFSADRAPSLSGEVYRLDSDGRLVDLSKSPFEDSTATVSPNGRRVAFASDRAGTGAIYVAAVDGSGIQRLASPTVPMGADRQQIELVWAPDSRRLAVISGNGRSSSLMVLGLGRKPVVLVRKPVLQPSWSPNGRLVTVLSSGGFRAYRATGGLAWRVRTTDGFFHGWSRRGLFVTILRNRVRIYDERGHARLSFPGRAAVWSDDGTRIASVVGGRVEVRTSAGRVLMRKALRGLANRRTGMVWAGPWRVVLFIGRPVGVDVRTGRVFPASQRAFGTRSPDGRFVVETKPSGAEFAVRVLRLDGSGATTYGRVPGCFDDGGFGAALQSLQFVPGRKSLVFESYCPEPPWDLYAVSPVGSALTKLTEGGKEYVTPSWSPDGTHLAYTRFDHTGLSCKGCPGSIWIADADGTNARLLVQAGPDGESALWPSWSPDGARILFARTSFTRPDELYVVPAVGGPATDLHVSGSTPRWGPARIAWVDFQTSPTSLWTAEPDGTGRQKIAEGAIRSPAWAADGRLAYLDGEATVVVVNGASTQKVNLPFTEVRSLTWSPDGTRFVVGARAAGTAAPDIYTLRADGTDVTRLTTDFDAGAPSWR